MKKFLKNFAALMMSISLLSSCGEISNSNNCKNDSSTENNSNSSHNNNTKKLYDYDEIKQGQTVDGEYSQFVNINVLSSYLGYGYDVVNDPYMNKNYINMSAPILDMNKIQDAKLRMIKENEAYSYSCEGSDMSQLIDSFSGKFNVDVGVGSKKAKVFSGGLKMSFKGSSDVKTYLKFYKNVYQVKTFNLYLTDSLSNIKNMVSDEFYRDVKQLTAKSLFNKYGTHLIREVAMGGRLELNSIWSSTDSGFSKDIEADVNTHIKFLSVVNLDVDANVKFAQKLFEEGIDSEIEGLQVGGRLVDVSTAEAMAKNKTDWLNSLNNDLSVSALSGIVGENSLIPLWDLLPDTEYDKKNELQKVFNAQCAESYDEICDLYKLNKNRDIRLIVDDAQGEVIGNESPYLDGDTVELVAKPKEGYVFDGWYISDELMSSNKTYIFDIHVNMIIEARFKKGNESTSELSHTHVFDEEWDYDEKYHWHNSTCEHSNLVDAKSRHQYNMEIIEPTYLEEGFTKYTCRTCNYTYIDNIKPRIEDLTIFEGTIRTGEYKVTGSGKICSASFLLNKTINQLKENGFNQVRFILNYQLREQDDCYIYVNLYDEYDNSLYYRRVEHGVGYVNYSYSTYTIEQSFSLDSLLSNSFRIEFKAENRWYKDFYVGLVTGKVIAEKR